MYINPVVRINQKFNKESLDSLIVSGQECYIEDSNGKQYLDLCGGIWNTPFGYSNIHIKNKIADQMNKLPFCNLISNVADVQYRYAEQLCKVLGTASVLYTCSGSESVEAAIKVCRQYQRMNGHNRTAISAFNLSYHGTSYGAMSISGIDKENNQDYYPLIGKIIWMEVPKDYTDIESWIAMVENHFGKYANELAGVIIEPILGSGGIIPIPHEILKKIEQLCNENNILFVLDEVSTGFGRAGVPFLFKYYELNPDLICLSKGITNGYLPLGVVAFSLKVSEAYSNSNTMLEHFSSQGGNLLSIAAALAVLDLMENYDEFQVEKKGLEFSNTIRSLCGENHKFDIRGKGLMLAISFPLEITPVRLLEIVEKLKKRGIIVYYFYNQGYNLGLSFFPPFTCSFDTLYKYAEKIVAQLKRYPEFWEV